MRLIGHLEQTLGLASPKTWSSNCLAHPWKSHPWQSHFELLPFPSLWANSICRNWHTLICISKNYIPCVTTLVDIYWILWCKLRIDKQMQCRNYKIWPNAITWSTWYVLDPQVLGARANWDAFISHFDGSWQLNIDAISVGSIAWGNDFDLLNVNILAPVFHNVEDRLCNALARWS